MCQINGENFDNSIVSMGDIVKHGSGDKNRPSGSKQNTIKSIFSLSRIEIDRYNNYTRLKLTKRVFYSCKLIKCLASILFCLSVGMTLGVVVLALM